MADAGSPDLPSGPPNEPSYHPTLPEGLEPVRLLGRGKVASVHLAREVELGRLVAVKVLRPDLCRDEVARQRFEREARSSASLTDPNVVSVHRFGRLDDGTPYLVMRYVTGRTLADRLAADGPMGEAEARRALVQVASALAAAHRKGIVHRDLRPENVLIDEESGRVMLSDFGLAAVLEESGASQRLTRTGQVLGEPHYASPEQLRGEVVTGQSDVYTLAVVAYEMLTGKGPYQAKTPQEWIRAHLTAEPIPLARLRHDVTPELDALLLRCLAREPAHRPRAEDLVSRLEGAATGGAPSATPGLELRRRRIPQLVGAAAATGVAIVGLMDALIDNTDLPPWTFVQVLNLVIWAFLGTCVVAWFHGERGRQSVGRVELTLLGMVLLGWAGTAALLFLG